MSSKDYLDRLMRRDSFEPLWRLFANAERPAKELTESFSALEHLRPLCAGLGDFRAIHVGDGAHCRTAAMFALKTGAQNLSVDPQINVALISAWTARHGIERLDWRKATIEDTLAEVDLLPKMPTIVTFVHAHVGTAAVLDGMRWDLAFTLACCVPNKQLTSGPLVVDSGEDLGVLSTGRRFEVLVNDRSRGLLS